LVCKVDAKPCYLATNAAEDVHGISIGMPTPGTIDNAAVDDINVTFL
jgi:hypothetical protein